MNTVEYSRYTIFYNQDLYAFNSNKILMYSNIMSGASNSANEVAAKNAGNALTRQYSDNFSEIHNDTIDKLHEWMNLANGINNYLTTEQSQLSGEAGGTDTGDSQAMISQNVNLRKSHYENQAIQYLYNWNKLLHYIYYFLAISLVIALFLSPNSFSIFMQVVVAIAVLLYPYYSVYVIKHIMKFYTDIRTLLPINVYTHYSDKHNYFNAVSAAE